ncbi:MAG: hypothetical protein HFH59_10020 [Lachnospiraceae bacterium]|nr:hypothetical protein [Lachnospiraceae bacterium]
MCEHSESLLHSEGHEHCCSHDHGHVHEGEKELLGIHISYHGEAVIFSAVREFPILYEKVQTAVKKALKELAVWVDKNGWLAGHIKGYVTDEPRSAMVSAVGNECSVIESIHPVVKLELACIVLFADEGKMCEKINQILKDIERV